jgi:hypothetical protein
VKHFVHPIAPGRIGVCYVIPGTTVASIVVDAPACARTALEHQALALSKEPAAYVPPEERPIVKGFYGAAQGDLF